MRKEEDEEEEAANWNVKRKGKWNRFGKKGSANGPQQQQVGVIGLYMTFWYHKRKKWEYYFYDSGTATLGIEEQIPNSEGTKKEGETPDLHAAQKEGES